MPTVSLKNVSMRFGTVTAVESMDLVIKDKEYVTILGPSGCGKTTLIKIIAGILEPTEGEVFIGEMDVRGVPTEERDIGYVFQNIALFPHLNVRDNVSYGPRVRDLPPADIDGIWKEYLDLVKLLDRMEMFPSELAGGEQQKVSLARALASGSKLLLLDEPLSALDARVRVDLRYDIRRLAKELGLTVIHVTHDQEEAMSVSDRIVLMRNGKVVETGTPINLYRSPDNIFTANFIGETNLLEGSINERDESGITIQLRDGSLVKASAKFMDVEDAVVLSVRPEYVYTASDGVQAEVVSVTFMGTHWRIGTRTSSEDDVDFDVQTSDKVPSIGDEVRLVFNKRMTMVYARPIEGIAEAIRLE
jgi:ABC-type Fe3+/spermidine/putrescine transport system ATPase subunit